MSLVHLKKGPLSSMNVADRLHIFIVTYNRVAQLKRTLRQILDEASPVKTCPITVLNNNSTDGTAALVNGFCHDHGNVELITHAKNIGGNANICRAMELADKEYYWILGDDDIYDFSAWNSVERAMTNGEDVILLSRYLLADTVKDDLAYQLVQATFISGVIVHADLITDSVLSEAYNSIYTLFPQIVPILVHVSAGGGICVMEKPVVDNGYNMPNAPKSDVRYTRGSDECVCSPYLRFQTWITGWSAAISRIKDADLRERTLMAGAELVLCYGEEMTTLQTMRAITSHLKGLGCGRLLPLAAYVYAVAGRPLQREMRRSVMFFDSFLMKRIFYCVCSVCIPWRKDYYLNRLKRYTIDV